MADVSFNVANPYQTQLDELARRQKMAEIMQQQSFQPAEKFSYQGIEAKTSPLTGLSKALQMYMSGREQGKISEERKALGERYKTESADTLRRAFEAGSGMPERAAIVDPQEMAQMADQGTPSQPNIPATAPNQQRMAQILMGSSNPTLEALGMSTMQKELENQRFMNAGNAPAVSTSAPVAPLQTTTSVGGAPDANRPPIASALARFGGPAGGQPMAVWMQLPNGREKYLEQLSKDYTDQNKPTDKIRELRAAGVREGSDAWNFALTDVATQGGIWRRGVDGVLSLAPGYARGVGESTRATEEAKARSAISTREVGGRNVTGTDEQFRILATGVADTEELAQNAIQWATRNGIRANILGPNSLAGLPQSVSGDGGSTTLGGVQNPTPAQAAQAKEFATAGAAGITKQLETSYDLAKNSVGRISTIKDLTSIIDLPAFSGPGATTQLLLGQLANKFYGAANAETLANTTLKLQGLADLSLKAAGLIKGQGSVTEPERELLAKAKSASEKLTVPEYKALFKIFEKQDADIVKGHQELLKRAQKAGVQNTDFYSVEVPIPSGLNLSPNAQRLLRGSD